MIKLNKLFFIKLCLSLLLLLNSHFLLANNADNRSISKKIQLPAELPREETFKNPIDLYQNKYFDLRRHTFKEGVTEEQKQLFYIDAIDASADFYEYYQFDRTEIQPILSAEELKQQELAIQVILDQCVALIGAEASDKNNRSLHAKQGDIYVYRQVAISNFGKDALDYHKNIQGNYLIGRTFKCTDYLYGDNYSLNDFDYINNNLTATDYKKRQEIEALYKQAYLKIKGAGLLRKLPHAAYYPKSLIRKHADQTGLTTFIQKQEQQAGKKLNHAELAVNYFGGYDKWIKSLNQYINNQI